MSNQYQIGDTFYLKVTHETYAFSTDTWTESDPDTGYPLITIKDPSGTTLIDAVAMTKAATGKFQYKYILTGLVAGQYSGFVESKDGGYPDREPFGFRIRS